MFHHHLHLCFLVLGSSSIYFMHCIVGLGDQQHTQKCSCLILYGTRAHKWLFWVLCFVHFCSVNTLYTQNILCSMMSTHEPGSSYVLHDITSNLYASIKNCFAEKNDINYSWHGTTDMICSNTFVRTCTKSIDLSVLLMMDTFVPQI